MAASSDVAVQMAVAQAKADIALALTEQFQKELNNLRDALEQATKENKALRSENESLRSRLQVGAAEGEEDVLLNNLEEEEAEAGTGRPPPEGHIFSNGGPYRPSKNERADTTRLKQELNRWTQAHGYSVKIMRSKLTGARVKLVVTCVLAGKPNLMDEQRRREKANMGCRINKPRVSKLRDCPLRFLLQEIVQGSGTFVVQHSDLPTHQRCNHEPDRSLRQLGAGL
ncbi:hypothetical protein M406DRAFT_325778 [Cryphonectria parasitica EP155]|uniref:Uncharacterized protein n=1 Tax=Cryphonectria parasitica (strain ATCC 38755 / EP155) TaxID=660469 RepID=A0A9P5CUD0_CRYP1|nr:uncharacterized protein M406DRAFT_325778 [Cryphonectria parasitica EP155]KAF3770331.1 hypothetical protein M406DRAFT_325778 [Cryphonectria parasitica EP155]